MEWGKGAPHPPRRQLPPTERLAARRGLSRVPFGTFVPLATALLRRSGGVAQRIL